MRLTLLGSVLAVGGLKEKILAAHQSNIHNIIIPALNKKDLADIPPKIRQQLTFTYADNMDQVIDIALLPAVEPVAEEHTTGNDLLLLRPEDRNQDRRTGLPAENTESMHSDNPTPFIIPPEHTQHDIFPPAHAERDDK